jgi:hypothetical protein
MDIESASDDPNGFPPNSIFRGLPPNDPIHVLVRVYVVKVINCVSQTNSTFYIVHICVCLLSSVVNAVPSNVPFS